MEYMSDYYAHVKESYKNNADRWGDNTDYGNHIPTMQRWIKNKHDNIVKNLTKYDISDLIEEPNKKNVNNNKEAARRYNGTYTVYGERVNNTENLQQGVYIINGKKILIK